MSFPKAFGRSLAHLHTGNDDCRWVQVEGLVHSSSIRGNKRPRNQEFELVYQPIVDVPVGEVRGRGHFCVGAMRNSAY